MFDKIVNAKVACFLKLKNETIKFIYFLTFGRKSQVKY